jgi:riboflavin biosynthesis pyrimidine reductase
VIVERLYPGPNAAVDIDDREALLELYRPPREQWLRLNLIATVTGGASGSDGTSETLTNPVDRRILGVIRQLADVVLIGAQSLRAEVYLQPKRSRLAIVTASGELGGHRIEAPEQARPIVLCPPSATARVRETLPIAEVLELQPGSDGTIAAASLIDALRAAGLPSIICEGGPSLAAQMLDAGLVDEFCLSTSPLVGGLPLPVTGSAAIAQHGATLTQLLRDETSGLYARWSLSATAASH